MIQNQKIKEFLNELSSDSPTPGGGAVAALTASMGVSLVVMALKISSNRRSFKELKIDEKDKVSTTVKELEKLKEGIDELIDEDAKVFSNYMKAFKDHDEDALARATTSCFNVPYCLTKLCLDAIEKIRIVDSYVVSSLDSDLKMSYILLKAALSSCEVNMKINITDKLDKESKSNYEAIASKIKEATK